MGQQLQEESGVAPGSCRSVECGVVVEERVEKRRMNFHRIGTFEISHRLYATEQSEVPKAQAETLVKESRGSRGAGGSPLMRRVNQRVVD
jgi:hypothetical protein